MISWLFDWVDRTTHVTPALRAFLWWGVALRTTLLFALGTLLAVEGNFLAKWLLSWQVAPASAAEIQEYTTVSYVALVAFLTAGVLARLGTLYRLEDASAKEPEPPAESSPDAPPTDAPSPDPAAPGVAPAETDPPQPPA